MKNDLTSNDAYSGSQLIGLVILRILIGWHFLYEGISKLVNPYWSSAAYLLDGKRVDSTHLHVKDWIDAIRAGGVPACNIEEAFHEAIACHMATESYIQGRRIEWDPTKRVLV